MGGEDAEKIVRIPGQTLLIKVSPEEEAYRKKYLPDAKRLTDEKLVCTVCSVSLAQNIHKGKDLYIHRALQVLVCEACYNFYGDGCFSADEDGDDKYCRWCGQGGTLYICATCNCAFCQKCTKQNLKASVLADLENDDWKCYICNPRPLFGCRTICWGAQQLNEIGKNKEQERLRKVKERLEKLEAKKKENKTIERKSRRTSLSEDDVTTKKRKRSSDEDSSSPEVLPKRRNRGSRDRRSLNGSIGRRRRDSSSNSESEDNKKITRHSRSTSKKEKTVVHSSSDDDSDSRSKKDKLRRRKKKKDTSDESSDTGKKKPNRRSVKKKDSSDEESSDDEKPKKKKKQSFKKRDDSSDSSNDEKKKKKLKKKKKSTSSEESPEESKKKKKTVLKKKATSSTEQSEDDEESSKSHKKAKSKPDEQSFKKQDIVDSDNDSRKGRKVTTDSEEVNSNSPEDMLVKKRIKLAILWLNTIVKDISELGTLISLRATKFSKKKINAENLKSYEDVLNCVSKIKQLVSGVHSNYDHIEKTLDSHLKPWKILTGLEEPDNEKNFMDGNISVANDGDVSKSDETTSKAPENSNTANNMDMNGTVEESKVEKINEKPEETINNWSDDSDDQNETRALISKANETLDRSKDEDDKQSENSQQFFKGLTSINTKDDGSESTLGSDIKESRQISKSDSGKPAESKLQSPKTSPSKSVKDVTGSTEKSSKSKKDPESDSNDDRFAKKSSPLTNSSEEGKKGEDCKNEVRAEKGKTELEGCEETSLQNDLQVLAQNQDSSEEDSAFSSFNLRLKDKWLSENSPKKMNLKDSLKNSSKESEASTVSAKSTNEKDLESKNREEPIPKIVLKKLAVGEINEENSPQTTNRSKEERGKKIRKKDQKKDEVKANGLSSEDDGNDDKKITKKKKVNHCKSKSSALDKKPNVLSSSDDDEQNKVAQKKVSNEEKIKKEKDKLSFESGEEQENYKNTSKERKTDVRSDKVKKENSMCLSSEEEEEEKIQNGRSKMSINIDKSSEDKLKSNSVKKGSKEMLKKNEDVSEKKTKRGTMHEEDSDDEIGDTTENIDKRIKPKENKKSKLKQNNSDVSEDIGNKKHKSRESKGGKKQGFDGNDSDGESSKSKRMKLKKSEKSKTINKSENEISTDEENKKSKKLKMNKSKQDKHTKETVEDGESSDDENTQIKNIKVKKTKDRISETAKNTNKDECSSVGLDSSDNEQTDNAEVKNEQTSYADDDEKASENCQVNAETSLSESKNSIENRSSDNECDTVSIQLALDLSSPENTNDTEMVLEEDLKSRKKQKDINEEKPEEMSTSSPEKVESTTVKNKFVGLDSSSDEEVKPKENKSRKKRAVRNQRKSQTKLTLSSDDEEEEPVMIESSNEDNDQKDDNDGDFTVEIKSSPESSDSEILPKNKRKKTNSSDSDDASISGDDTKKKKKKRRRIKCADSSEESGASGDEKLDTSQKNNEGESPAKGGRKNIKKIKKKGDLEQTTIEAAEEEKERRKRIEERQKLFNQVFEAKESAKLDKLVLDFDPESKSELISVNKDLVVKMKPHQAKGVKFMWDSCFESVKQIKKTKGSGCILAHCMGLGKTFQVISLVHTLLTHEEYTKVRTVMVVCPLSTVLNWVNEFGKWLEGVDGGEDIEVFHLTKYNKNPDRARELRRWQHNGGVLIMGYEMFRNLTNETTKKFKAKMKKDFLETLIDPGADLIVCDEGHMLKNEATALSKAMTRVRTLRRIVLTGTPMQNNLKEYHCMVQFVKPNLLGTSKEFLNRFVNPINNGQFVDSTDHDVKLMKRRAHVLHKMLEGLVQRFDYNVLTPFLPPKQEYVISVCLSELQEKLYSYYLENESQKAEGMKGGTRLFMDWQTLGRVWTHPRVLKMSTDKANWLKEKKAMEESDSEGSLRDFIDDDSEKSTTTIDSSSDDDSSSNGGRKKKRTVHKSRSTRSTRQTSNVALLESSDEEKRDNEAEDAIDDTSNKGDWWTEFVEPVHFEDMRQSGKLLLLFAILKECEMIEDKVLVFSQSLFSLDLIEYFLDKIDAATQEGRLDENLDNHQGTWSKGLDYFRLDGSTSSENRNIWCKSFNREDNPRARLFLISTRAGGLGINLTAANRVIIFDASWNPSHDIQSIFRIYRFGQKKPCYVYRFVAHGTMEEKVYERQVAKQSISNRVVDEQQVHRHFSMNDLTELYTFTPSTKLEDRPTPTLPRDPLMAEILSQMKQWIEKYHEHDSLLENVVEEELNEEERKAAWEDYENDKKRGFMPPAGPQGPAMNPNAAWNQQIEIMRQQLKLRYADKSDDEINSILVYQVSILMRQQQQQQMQMAAQMQAAGNMGYRPQMYGNNMMFNQRPQMQTTAYLRNIAPKPSSQQNYSADQVYRMQQQANLARLQQQMAQQQKSQQQSAPNLQSLLMGQAGTKYPSANIAQLQRMKQNYQASRQVKPGVTITEITDDGKPSGSSES